MIRHTWIGTYLTYLYASHLTSSIFKNPLQTQLIKDKDKLNNK